MDKAEPIAGNEEPSEDSALDFTPTGGKPLYEQVSTWLLNQVTSGRWPIHHMLPPEIVLAKDLGVSRITLRKAMSDLVQHGVFTRISGRGTFVAIQDHNEVEQTSPLIHQGHLTLNSESRLIGVVVPSTTSAFVSTILAHMEHALYEHGYRMLLTNSNNSLTLQEEHLRQLVDLGVAGIILYSGAFMHDQSVINLVRRKFPLVMIDRYYPAMEKQVHLVASDNVRGAYLATEHLLRLGHRRIGLILGKTEIVTSSLARFEGYKTALKDYGVSFEEDLVIQAQISGETVPTYLTRAKPTAVFACNDLRAIEFLHVLNHLTIRVPDDLALVGFDDIPLVSRLNPPLTTVAQNVHQLGETSAHLLMDVIEGYVTKPQSITIPTELIVRQSCGASKLNTTKNTNVVLTTESPISS